MSYRTPPCNCLNCGRLVDAATPHDGGRRPKEGDISICLYCGHVAVYGTRRLLREPTGEEIVDMAGEPALVEAMKFVKFAKEHWN